MNEYQFTYDWAKFFRDNIDRHFKCMANLPLNYLEVGVYEANSTTYVLDNVLTHAESRAVLVDNNVQPLGWNNLERHASKIKVYEGNSRVILPKITEKFDIIYIDGDHSARGCLFDTVLCWLLLKNGGFIIWDDYQKHDDDCKVHQGVKNFLDCLLKSQYKVVFDNYQFCIQCLVADTANR